MERALDLAKAGRGRVLIFVVAYRAERHVVATFQRIPRELFNDEAVHILCIDDASSDETSSVLSDWVRANDIHNVTVLRNPVNQGYGGNQKLGYRLALEWGFDFVILLHGDGQYAPELLPKFIEVWRETDSDVVLGSRMQSLRQARAGGMPIYKLIGNRILTVAQNRLAGLRLSEWHTGYRGYSTRFLRKVPFEINTNDFHFDTEILLQATYVDAKITEFPIPTHYGDEVCHVPGVRYARHVIAESFRFKLHRMGMLCSLKYRDLAPINYASKTQMRYTSHSMALREVAKAKPQTVLDIGCGPGFVAQECQKLGAKVTGLDIHEPLPGMMSEFHRFDLQQQHLPVDAFAYDVVLLLDIIEHLENPEQFLLNLRNQSQKLTGEAQSPLLILSTPNIAFAAVRLNLLLGRFNYGQRGILDITHKRLFTRHALIQSLRDCGYEIQKVRGVPVPVEAVMPTRLGRLMAAGAALLAWIWPTMFAFQWLVTCRPRPGVNHLLAVTERRVLSSLPIPQVQVPEPASVR